MIGDLFDFDEDDDEFDDDVDLDEFDEEVTALCGEYGLSRSDILDVVARAEEIEADHGASWEEAIEAACLEFS